MVVISSGCDDNAEPEPPLVDPFEEGYDLCIDFVSPDGEHLVNSIVNKPIDDVMKYSIGVDCDTFLSDIGPSTECHSTNAHLEICVMSALDNWASTITTTIVCPTIFGDSEEHIIYSEWENRPGWGTGECSYMSIDGVEYPVCINPEYSVSRYHATVTIGNEE